MKANELRIGNFLQSDTNIIKIVGVVKKDIYYYHNKKNLYVLELNNLNFQPLELTEEWLLKFGFENSAIGYEYAIKLDITLQLIDVNNEYYPQLIQAPEFSSMESQIINLNSIKYLHQLQNLYFALTNEELTIM